MKKTVRIILIFILTLIILSVINSEIYASGFVEAGMDTLDKGLFGAYLSDDTAMDLNITIGSTSHINDTKVFTENILGYLQVIGSIISVIALLIIGFRYMFSTLEEKAQMKGILIYYIVGAVLVFATSNLLSVVYNIMKGLSI